MPSVGPPQDLNPYGHVPSDLNQDLQSSLRSYGGDPGKQNLISRFLEPSGFIDGHDDLNFKRSSRSKKKQAATNDRNNSSEDVTLTATRIQSSQHHMNQICIVDHDDLQIHGEDVLN